MDSAFALYHSLGLDAIKSGYVTDFVGEGHSHYGQYMVRHHRHVIEKAAQYGIMLDVHEPIHDTGERRTYPNMMSREGAALACVVNRLVDGEHDAARGDRMSTRLNSRHPSTSMARF